MLKIIDINYMVWETKEESDRHGGKGACRGYTAERKGLL